MKKILLTGATGVIGRRVVPRLVADGHLVVAVARTPEKAASLTSMGAEPTIIDLFNAEQVVTAAENCDAVVHLATNIPLGAAAARKSTWKTNDRLRTEAASNLATAAIEGGARTYVGESITFPYLDGGSDWVTEAQPRDYHFGNRTVLDAEAAAQRVTDHGGVGVMLRFAMFHAPDSGHIGTFLSMAKWGIAPFLGATDGYQSFVEIEDAATAVVAALDVPAGVYNVAEPDPMTREAHARELANLVGKSRLRSIPRVFERVGGEAAEELSRSQRISSQALQEASRWEPRVPVIDRWKLLA